MAQGGPQPKKAVLNKSSERQYHDTNRARKEAYRAMKEDKRKKKKKGRKGK